MKITKARLKQIIIEELEAVKKEDEDEDSVEEGFISRDATNPQTHRDRPGYQRATLGGRGAPPEGPGVGGDTPTLDAAADALGLSPSDLMMQLAKEMGVDLGTMGLAGPGDEDISERRRRKG